MVATAGSSAEPAGSGGKSGGVSLPAAGPTPARRDPESSSATATAVPARVSIKPPLLVTGVPVSTRDGTANTAGIGTAGGKPGRSEKDQVSFTSTPSLLDQPRPMAPERYGKYNLLERIGVGGMAEVWRAKTLGAEGFTKDLVIKRILPKFTGDEESVRMFIDEARLVAKMHHPNIVQIFDFDKEGDRYYLAMELVEGRDLRQAEKSAAKAGVWFPVPMSVYLIAEALKGLHYAHTRLDHGKALEIVHRDVSPHNILISFSGDVKISDFGIAKVAERASSATTGTVKGKLAYMSPEQITGQPLDGRTDIYSMGIVFWELLTRHRLFFGPDEHDVIRRVRDGIVPPPRQYNPEIPEEVEKIVLKMLVPNRAQRYQSAGEVARHLTAVAQYQYEAQSLGEFMRTLFPEKTRNWTKVLQSMLSNPSEAAPGEPAPLLGTLASAAANAEAAAATAAAEAAAANAAATAAAATAAAATAAAAAAAAAVPAAGSAPPTGPQPVGSTPQSVSPPPPGPPAGPPAAPVRPSRTMPPVPPPTPRQLPTPPTAVPEARVPSQPDHSGATIDAEVLLDTQSGAEIAPAPRRLATKSMPPPAPQPASKTILPQSGPLIAPAVSPPAPRSTMAGSDQKTQMATELPPEVAAALGRPPGSAAPAANITGARTMIAEAPQLPGPPAVSGGLAPPPAPGPSLGPGYVHSPGPPASLHSGARTVIAAAPTIPSPGPSPGPSAGPGLGGQGATVYSMPAPSVPGPGMQATLPPGAMRPSAGPPAQLRPAGMVFPTAAPAAGMPPTARWVIGPVIALVMALITAAIANRIWPPAQGASAAPSFLAATRKVTIIIEQPGAEVQVDGTKIEKKSPTEAEVKGEIGKTAAVRITLDGYDPYESRILFTKDARPPLRVKLRKPGEKPAKVVDPTAFDPTQGVKNPDDEDAPPKTDATKTDKPEATKPETGDKSDKPDKGDKSDKPEKGKKGDKADKPDKGDKSDADEDEDEDGKHKHRHKDKGDAKGDVKGDPKAKGTVTITVRPWAIVYVDGKKIQQTPMRDYGLSSGNHTLILENSNKGKREVIKIKVTAGEKVPLINRVWE